MAPPGTLGQFHALLGSPSGTGLSAAEPAWVTGNMDLLLRFSEEMWNGQRLSLKLAADGRMGAGLVAGICFFLHICFNLMIRNWNWGRIFCRLPRAKACGWDRIVPAWKAKIASGSQTAGVSGHAHIIYAEPLHSQPSRRWDGEVTLACSLLLFLL